MKKLLLAFVFIITIVLYNDVYSQCTVDITPATVNINCGESVDLSALGLSPIPALSTDFNGNQIGAGWATTATLVYDNPCGPSLDGTASAWFGNVPLPRTLTTNGFDMSCGGQVCFDLDFAGDDACGGCSDCEDPDQTDEGVFFQYSVDGGTTWIDIFYFEATNNYANSYYAWDSYCFTLPPAAWSVNTMFQWDQPQASSSVNDHWGIDNVTIIPSDCGYWYDWANIPGTNDPSTQTVSPMVTTTYDVDYTDGVDICSASVTVVVNPLIASATTSNANLNCGDCADLDVVFTNNNAGSIIDDFDPAEDPSMWSDIQSGSSNTDCGSMTGNAIHFDGTSSDRSITSVPINATVCGMIQFCLFMGNSGSGGAPCENADANENVALEYSTDGGLNWTSIVVYDQSLWDNNNVWQCNTVPIPPLAQTLNTMFRWRQTSFTSCSGCDNWALDDVSIACTPPALNYSWTPTTDLDDATIQNPQTCTPTDIVYTATITNPATGCSATDDVAITVAPCACQFNVFTANVNQCEVGGTYSVSGDFEYNYNPTTGTIVVEATNGSGTYTQVFNAPFISSNLYNYSIGGIPSDGTPVTVTIYFSDELTCTSTLNETSPILPTVTGTSGGANYCVGDVINDILVDVTGTGPWTIDFTIDGNPGVANGAVSPVSLGNAPGVYVVTNVTDANCTNTAIGTETIIEFLIPDAGVDAATSFCATGSPSDLFPLLGVTAVAGGDWFDPANTPITMPYDPTTMPVGQYTYEVTVNGCVNTAFVDITHIQTTITSLTANRTSCNGFSDGSIVLDGNNVDGYTVDGGTPIWTPVPTTITGLPAGDYTIQVLSIDGCSDVDVINVPEPDVLTLAMNVVDASCFGFCDGSAMAVVNGGTMPYSYTWLQGVNGTQNGSASQICSGNYQAEVTDVSGCFADVTYFIDQPDNVIPSFLVDTASGCFPHQVDFMNTTASTDILTTDVDFGDGSFGSYTGTESFAHVYEDPGIYSVTMTITTNLGCEYVIVYDDLIQAYDHPIADFYVNPDFVSMLEPTVSLYNSSSLDATGFSWSIFDGNPATANTEDVKDVSYPFDAPGLYPVTLTVTSDYGCQDTIQKFVTIQNDILLYAPNTFTPDDDEHNQSWDFHISGIDIYDFNLKIFNRWGEVIWENNDPSISWDGIFNGRIVQDGMYSWSMECGDSQNDKRYTFNGHINVIR